MKSHSKETMSWRSDSYFLKVAIGGIMPNTHGSHEEESRRMGLKLKVRNAKSDC